MEHKDISEISDSQTSLSEADALIYMQWIWTDPQDYIRYNETNYPEVRRLANAFINNHSLVDLNYAQYYTHQPIHVYRYRQDGRLVEGLIYSNGVVNLEWFTKEIPAITLWIRNHTIRTFNYPLPDVQVEDGYLSYE